MVDAVANGLGLVVIDAPTKDYRDPDGEVAVQLSSRRLPSGHGPQARRMLIGLVHLGIAAVAYPT